MNCALIGSTKIAKIHLRELIKNNIKNFTFISRDKKKSKLFVNSLKKKKFFNFNSSNHNIFKKKKFRLIDICSNSNFHTKHLLNIPKQQAKILVEKPIISLKRQKTPRLILDKLYLKHKNIFVSYPMFYLAESFKKSFDFKDKHAKKIDIYYQTTGKHNYREIFDDLCPHAFAFIFSIMGVDENIDLSINKISLRKKEFKCKGKINETKFNISFLQYPEKNKSVFKFNVNNEKIRRITKIQNKNFVNYLKSKNKTILIKNPMSSVVKEFLKKDYKKVYAINKKLTYLISEITQEIYDKSF